MLTERRSLIVIEEFDQFYRSVHGEKFASMALRHQLTKHCIGMYMPTTYKKLVELRTQLPHIVFVSPTSVQLRDWFHISMATATAILEEAFGDLRVVYERVLDQLPAEAKHRDQTVQQLTEKLIRTGGASCTMEDVLSCYDMGTSALQMSLYETVPQDLWHDYRHRKNRTGFIKGFYQMLDNYVTADPFHNAIYNTMDPHMTDYVGVITCAGAVDVVSTYRASNRTALNPVTYPNHLNRIAQIATNRNATEKAIQTFPGLSRIDVYYVPRLMYISEWSEDMITWVNMISRRYEMTKEQWEILLRGNRFMKDRERSIVYRHLKGYQL